MTARFCLLAVAIFFVQAFGANALQEQQKECIQAVLSADLRRSEALRSKDMENVRSMFSVERTIA